MATHHSPSFLRTLVIKMVTLAALAGGNTVGAAGIDNNGDYDDGSLVWSKILNQYKTYPEAVDVCLKKTQTDANGKKWELPTEEQMRGFYQHVAMNSLSSSRALHGWTLGGTWTSSEVSVGKHEMANLGNGVDDWNGRTNTETHLVTCIASAGNSYYDGELTWLKISTDAKDKKSYKAAKQYCASYDKGREVNRAWTLPSVNQLKNFYSKIVNNRKAALIKGGWALDKTWSSVEDFMNIPSGSFTNYSIVDLSNGTPYNIANVPDHYTQYVTCVR